MTTSTTRVTINSQQQRRRSPSQSRSGRSEGFSSFRRDFIDLTCCGLMATALSGIFFAHHYFMIALDAVKYWRETR